jgi:hypothetical protein
MQRVEDPEVGPPSGVEDLSHVRNAPVGFGNAPKAIPEFSAFGDEVVVGIDHHQAGEALVICHRVIFSRSSRELVPECQTPNRLVSDRERVDLDEHLLARQTGENTRGCSRCSTPELVRELADATRR